MSRQVNTYAQLIGTSGPVAPGAVEGWWASVGGGDDYARALWFEAHPLGGRPGNKSFEVRAKRANEANGNRSFTCDVVNMGATAMYALFVYFTDKV